MMVKLALMNMAISMVGTNKAGGNRQSFGWSPCGYPFFRTEHPSERVNKKIPARWPLFHVAVTLPLGGVFAGPKALTGGPALWVKRSRSL